jgi:multiple antibiotic resistance protein
MEHAFLTFMHTVFVGFVALFAPVNPLGTALIVEPFLKNLRDDDRRRAAASIAFYCLGLSIVVTCFGGFFFSFFGISIPVVQMAGGFLICKMGLSALSLSNNGDSEKEASPTSYSGESIKGMLFYPLAFPTTMGGGTISVLLALSANNFNASRDEQVLNQLALVLACILMCALVFMLNHESREGDEHT